ncbi:unnamed protein product [marine sediment metagenome]|uniref:Uncharacterized protein n=1 Tax=marine sediment metagenome TaxID=412755 RepID=X1TRB4_9ZZZZ
MPEKMKRFSDMRPDPLPCDEKIDVEAILDQDVMWVDFQELSGKTVTESVKRLRRYCHSKVTKVIFNEPGKILLPGFKQYFNITLTVFR